MNRYNERWTEEENNEIRLMFRQGWPSNYIKKIIMQKYKRTKGGVDNHVQKIMREMYDHAYQKKS